MLSPLPALFSRSLREMTTELTRGDCPYTFMMLSVPQDVIKPQSVGAASDRQISGGGHHRSAFVLPSRPVPPHPPRPQCDISFRLSLSQLNPACMPSTPTLSPPSCPGSVISGGGADCKKRRKLKTIGTQGHAALSKCSYVLLTSKTWRLQGKMRQSRRQGVEMNADWLLDKPRLNYWLRVAASNLASQSPCLAGVTQSHCNPQ